MNSIVIGLAGLNIKINYRNVLIKEMCKEYIVKSENIDFVSEASIFDIEKYSKESNETYGEFLAIYESIASKLAEYNRVLIHGAAIAYKNLAYLFLAPSGVGKSTHIKLWKDNIKNVCIINGDKPIIDSDGYIYGTPWAGKEKWNTNIKCKLDGIILLHRGINNVIEKVNKSDYLDELLSQIYRNSNFDKSVSIFDEATKNVQIYNLSCNSNPDAARVCFDAVING